MYTSPDKVIQTIDIKEGVDAFKFEALNGKEALGPQKDYAKIRPTVSKVRKKIESKFIRSSVSALPQEPEFIDSTGKLEERLGGEASETTNTAETSADVDETQILAEIRSVYSAEPEEKGASSKKERELIPEPMIDKVMNAKEFNRANRRPFPGITVKEMMKGSVDPGRQKSSINFKVIKKRPKVKGLKTKREPIRMTRDITVEMPSTGKELGVIIRSERTGEMRRIVVAKKPDYRLPMSTVRFYKFEEDVPNVQVSPLENNQVNVLVTRPQRSAIDGIEIYRREISDRQWEDEYELIQTLSFATKEEFFMFTDIVGNERLYKYVCLPIVGGTRMPVFSYRIYRTANWKSQRSTEPIIYGYQQRGYVRLSIRNLPFYANKVLIYRNSSLDGEEILVDGRVTSGRRSSMLTFYDRPSPVEQEITYVVRAVDRNGIVHSFLDKPLVKFTATLGNEPGRIRSFYTRFNRDEESVEMRGVVTIPDAYLTKDDASLSNPSDSTIKAAARGLKIVRLAITRIDLLTGEEEILMEPIINVGVSDIESRRMSGDRIAFSLKDNSETAVENGYTPILPNRTYLYICRVAAYPLGVELRNVAGIATIPGKVAQGRLPYEYDPFIFDHPSNVELGILPARFSQLSRTNVMEIAKTSSARSSQVFVPKFELDVQLDIALRIQTDYEDKKMIEIKFSIPDYLTDDLDHIELIAGVDSLDESAVIDRMFIPNSSEFAYYDYQMLDQIGESVFYQIKGRGLDFKQLFLSQEVSIMLPDDEEDGE